MTAQIRVMSDDEIVRRSAAHHEAGHCVVGLRLGVRVDGVSLKVQPRLFRHPLVDGHAYVGDDDSDKTCLALVAAGGPAAEAWWNHLARGIDFAECHQWTQRYNPEDAAALDGYARAERLDRRHIVSRAVELVTMNWSTVAHLAEALLAHGHLNRQQIHQLVSAGAS